MTMLEVNALNQYYGESHILRDVELSVPRGACVCLMGRNGVGKTTLLKSIMGLLKLRSGKIRFDGTEIEARGPEHRARFGIGYVPQGREIFSDLDVEENLLVGIQAARRPREKSLERAYAVFPALKKLLRRRGGDLSGGQQQQVAIGRALALSPSLLVLDEPTEGIQPNVVHDIGDVLIRLNQEEKLTLLVVEQKLAFARRVGTHYAIMDRGRLVATGAMPDLTDALVHRYLVV
jgi:urea transport system ATP-binding protein